MPVGRAGLCLAPGNYRPVERARQHRNGWNRMHWDEIARIMVLAGVKGSRGDPPNANSVRRVWAGCAGIRKSGPHEKRQIWRFDYTLGVRANFFGCRGRRTGPAAFLRISASGLLTLSPECLHAVEPIKIGTSV
jgi:hypothetical protein